MLLTVCLQPGPITDVVEGGRIDANQQIHHRQLQHRVHDLERPAVRRG